MNDRDIFAEAVALEATERAKFLVRACAGDDAQRARIEALLAAHEATSDFLERPVVPGLLAGPLEIKPGDRIGPYTLRQKLGEGGCGIVWMAEQDQPLRRRVALKVIKLGMDTREVIARFEAERQALARMDHPNIAKVLDAGATESGRPYFVMELVRGVPLTKYCDELALPTSARLQLFVQICQAIQHAHQKGVIHRDLKPSNILVTLTDAGPVPKVIDFGIAKATQGRLADHTIYTSFEQFIGTPAYISPEQAELSGLDIDTRSDIYSLGVLLYELLTGRTPFDPKELALAGLDEMRRRIRETEPERPSTRLGTLQGETLALVARHRHAAPPDLLQQVRGDLDWIVMRCLEKDRTRRYASANALADDVSRHLHDEPVVARPPSRVYRFRKLVRRNRLAFGATAAVFAALAVGVMVATIQAVRAKHAEQAALNAGREQARLREVAERAQANEAAARLRAESEGRKAAMAALTAKRAAYATDMRAIQAAVNQSNFDYARTLLNRHRPTEATAPDFRGWEWRYWWQQMANDYLGTLRTDIPVYGFTVSSDSDWLAGFRPLEPFGLGVTVLNRRTCEQRVLPTGVRLRYPAVQGRLAFAPTSPLLAVASLTERDGNELQPALELWDVTTLRQVGAWPLPAECKAVYFSSDGKTLLTWIAHKTTNELIEWQTRDGELVRRIQLPEGLLVAVDRGWGRAAIGDRQRVRMIDLTTDRELWESDFVATTFAFSPDGKVLASGFKENGVKLSDAGTGMSLGTLPGHRQPINGLVFRPDGQSLATCSLDQTIRIWDVKTLELKCTLIGAKGLLNGLALMPDGRTLVSASGGEFAFWDSERVPRIREPVQLHAQIVHWQFENAGSVIAVDRNGDVVRWHGERWATKDHRVNVGAIRPEYDTQPIIQLSVQPPLVAVSHDKGIVAVWDWERRVRVREISTGARQATVAGFLDNGRRVLLTCPVGGERYAQSEWDIQSGRLVYEWSSEVGPAANAISADGRTMVTMRKDRWSLIDVVNGTVARTVASQSRINPMRTASFSPDGRFLAVPLVPGIFELPGLDCIAKLESTETLSGIRSTTFSPDGQRLAATGGMSASLILYDTRNWERILSLDTLEPQPRVDQVRISPDNNVLGLMLLPPSPGTVYLWRAPTLAEIDAAEAAEKAAATSQQRDTPKGVAASASERITTSRPK